MSNPELTDGAFQATVLKMLRLALRLLAAILRRVAEPSGGTTKEHRLLFDVERLAGKGE